MTEKDAYVGIVLRLRPQVAEEVTRLAHQLNVPRARLLRRAVEEYVRNHKHDKEPPRRRKGEQRKLVDIREAVG